MFWISIQIFSEIFLILRRNETPDQKCTSVVMHSAPDSYQILMNLEFSGHIFGKL